jgi:hypothetical protein
MSKEFEEIKAGMVDYIYKYWPIRLILAAKGYDDDLNEWIENYTSACARNMMTIGGAKWNG